MRRLPRRRGRRHSRVVETDPRLAAAFAAVDAANARAERTLAGESRTRSERDPLVYDPDWDEDARLVDWRAAVDRIRTLPPALAAAIATRPGTRSNRSSTRRGSAACSPPRCSRTRQDPDAPGVPACRAEDHSARTAADHLTRRPGCDPVRSDDGGRRGRPQGPRPLATPRTLLARKLAGRRSTSKLPALLDYVLTRPIVSAGMIAKELGITPRAAQNLVAELGLREATGRGRYRAWGIL